MQDLRIALIQTNQVWEDKEANFTHLENVHFCKISKGAVDFLILPEMFNTGFSMKSAELAEEMSGKSVQWLKKWAQVLDCQIGASLIISENGSMFNRFVIVSKHKIEAIYDKRHLFRMALENDHFSPGTLRVIHAIGGWKILLQVCYDLRFPVFSRNRVIANELDYDAVVYIANWPEKRSEIWSVLLQARAIENQAFCIGVNRVGVDGNGISYSGDSAVIDPWGTYEFRATKSEEQVKILTLQYAKLTLIRNQFPAYKDAD